MATFDLLVFAALTILASSLLLPGVRGNSEGDALYALRRSLSDPDKVLQSWDPNLVTPCTWFHVTCNQDNRVTRVYVFLSIYLSVYLYMRDSCSELDVLCVCLVKPDRNF